MTHCFKKKRQLYSAKLLPRFKFSADSENNYFLRSISECTSVVSEEGGGKKTVGQMTMKIIKLSLPHIGLTALLVGYIVAGGYMFMHIERPEEEKRIAKQTEELGDLHKEMTMYTWSERDNIAKDPTDNYREKMIKCLEKYSKVLTRTRYNLEGKLESDNREKLHPVRKKWTWRPAVLYALTVISSTGYNKCECYTNVGKILTMAYGLIGIPLMFITAVNIGKLFSELILSIWSKLRVRLYASPLAVRVFRLTSTDVSAKPDTFEVSALLICALLVGCCGLGASFYVFYKPEWSYVNAYHVSFEGMISLALEDIGIDSWEYVVLLTAYKILSLAVLTMCLDLARLKILRLFRRIHYFGRKIKFDFSQGDQSTNLSKLMVDPRFKHILPDIIKEIYETHPDIANVTSEDVFNYMRFLGEKQRVLREEYNQAYIPEGYNRMKYIDSTLRAKLQAGRYLATSSTATATPSSGAIPAPEAADEYVDDFGAIDDFAAIDD